MEKAKFVYVTFIETTPEKLWNALTDPEITKEYWVRRRNESDWKAGSGWQQREDGETGEVDLTGTVLESDPPRRLVFTWASPEEVNQPEKISRVTYEIEPQGEAVKLTVIHDELEPGSSRLRSISGGWPLVLSSLKSLLETGKPLALTTKRCESCA